MPGKKPLPLGGVSSSEPRRKSSELHSRLSSSAFTAAREAPNVRELPTLSSSVHSDEEALPPFRRKRAASGEGPSRAKKARSLSTDGTPVTRAAMSSEEFDSDDSAFDNRSLSRCARKSKLQLAKTSLEDLKPHHAHHQGQTLPSEAASSSVSAQETEEDDMTFSRDCLVKSVAVPSTYMQSLQALVLEGNVHSFYHTECHVDLRGIHSSCLLLLMNYLSSPRTNWPG